jgi:hypothetical protein
VALPSKTPRAAHSATAVAIGGLGGQWAPAVAFGSRSMYPRPHTVSIL